MRPSLSALASTLLVLSSAGCGHSSVQSVEAGMGPDPDLPPQPSHESIPTVEIAPAVGWSDGSKPTPAAGLAVNAFASGLEHPRWVYVLPNGDVLVAETAAPERTESARTGIKGWFMKRAMKKAGSAVPSANRISLLRDTDGDGVAETKTAFLGNLNSPFGMALVGEDFYVANTDAVVRFPYAPGATQITAPGTKLADLPAGTLNHHWTKNVIASRDGAKLYATVGSNSNAAEMGIEREQDRAAIHEIDRATGARRQFAGGLRNPNGLAWEPRTGALWTAVNERDEIGGDLVPDYMTSVKDGGFYGWPYSYYGQRVDERVQPQDPGLVARAIKPDYALGPHTASLGLAFAEGAQLGPAYAEGAFVGQHGSWNRKPPSGYRVIFVPFAGGHPNGDAVEVLTGFLDGDGNARGRPVGVAIAKDGALLVADDVGNVIWRVSAGG